MTDNRTNGDTSAAVVAAIQRIAREQGVSTLSYSDYQRHRTDDDPAAVTATRLFGNWKAGLRAAGLVVDDAEVRTRSQVKRAPAGRRAADDDEAKARVIAAIQRIAAELGGVTTLSTNQYVRYVEDDEPAVITAIRRFKGWKNACAAAGLDPNPYSKAGEVHISDEEALGGVQKAGAAYAEETGKAPRRMTQDFYTSWREANDGLGLPNLAKRFGGWAQVKAKAGLE
ncbi:homing endonuclease associated repeat-containing protein [Gordonia malaquae]|uniref:homing endonuclease associated repeat-containing protein n=1 Tax=Gordonia malaquae TaxID=410332 RepID=UPI003015B450